MKQTNKKLTIEQKKEAYKKNMNELLNPIPEDEFNPETFDPIIVDGLEGIQIRERKVPIGKLPTYGLAPKEVMEGQMIGMYESKQDLYLLLAHKINELLDRIEVLEKELNKKQANINTNNKK